MPRTIVLPSGDVRYWNSGGRDDGGGIGRLPIAAAGVGLSEGINVLLLTLAAAGASVEALPDAIVQLHLIIVKVQVRARRADNDTTFSLSPREQCLASVAHSRPPFRVVIL